MYNNTNVIGKEVIYRPTKKKCKVINKLDNGEVIVQFGETVIGGHSLDGQKPQGTCLNTDEELLTLRKEVPALKLKMRHYDG